jgi:hypothetical protein
LMMQNSGPIGSAMRASSHGSSSCHPQSSIPTSRRRPPLPRRTSSEPRRRSRSASRSESASSMRRPARHNTTTSPRSRRPCTPSPAIRMTATISSTVGGSAGYRRPLLRADDRRESRASSPATVDDRRHQERAIRSRAPNPGYDRKRSLSPPVIAPQAIGAIWRLPLGPRSESAGRYHRTPPPLLSRMELESDDAATAFPRMQE